MNNSDIGFPWRAVLTTYITVRHLKLPELLKYDICPSCWLLAGFELGKQGPDLVYWGEVLFVPAGCEDDLHHLGLTVEQSGLAWCPPNIVLQPGCCTIELRDSHKDNILGGHHDIMTS